MNSLDLISVIMPAYNAEKYIGKSILSVLNQTYQNIELIIVDDGSNDRTDEICKQYVNQHSAVHYYQQENSGPAKARENGIKRAKGNLVFFLDSDDYLDRFCLERLYTIMYEKLVDIVQCSYLIVDDENKILKHEKYKDEHVVSNLKCSEFFSSKKNTNNYMVGRLYKKELFDKISFSDYYYSEDYYVLSQLYYYANSVFITSEELYFYVQTANSLCRSNFSPKRLDTLKAGELVYLFYKKNINEEKICGQAASYICSNASRLYILAAMSGYKKKYGIIIKNYFNKYYKLSKNNYYISVQRRIMQCLFSFSPSLCAWIVCLLKIEIR